MDSSQPGIDLRVYMGSNVSTSCTDGSYCVRRCPAARQNARIRPYVTSQRKYSRQQPSSCYDIHPAILPGQQLLSWHPAAAPAPPLAANGIAAAASHLQQLQKVWVSSEHPMDGTTNQQQVQRRSYYLDAAIHLANQSLADTMQAMQVACRAADDSAACQALDCAEAAMEKTLHRTKLAVQLAAIMHTEQRRGCAADYKQSALWKQQQPVQPVHCAEEEEDGEVSSCWHPCPQLAPLPPARHH